MNEPILVVLAAGMGSRYGGLKQMDSLGANGEVLLDYSVFDAIRSGFGKIVFIIRRDIEKDFSLRVLKRLPPSVSYALAFQEMDSLIPPALFEAATKAGRSKPWGTSHALLCAAEEVDAPFAVINADDFYGREAFTAMGAFLSKKNLSEGALIPYRLDKTLSPKGSVTRGVCGIKDGVLVSVDELKAIAQEDAGIFNTAAENTKQALAPDTPVSMNFWGFPPSIFPDLHRYFDAFLAASGLEPKSECYLPAFAGQLVKDGRLVIRSLDANSEWFGVTYQEDRAEAVKRIAALTAASVYPEKLWNV